MNKLRSAADLEKLRNSLLSQRDLEKIRISICGGTGCRAYKCMDVVNRFKTEIEKQGIRW